MFMGSISSRLTPSSLIVVCLLLVAWGCGGDFSPTAPSLTGPSSSATLGGQSASVISGQLLSGGGAVSTSGAFEDAASAVSPTNVVGLQVTVQGTSITTWTGPDGSFQLLNIPNGNVVLLIVGSGVNTTVTVSNVGASQNLKVTIQVQGNSAQVVNTEVEELGEFEGLLASVDTLAGSFTLQDGTTIFVESATWWDTGGDIQSLEALALAALNGQTVELEGRTVTTAAGLLLATVVKADVDDAELKVDGFVVAVDRTALTLTLLDGTVIAIDSDLTEWKLDGDYTSFDALADAFDTGVFIEVEVEGSLSDDGTVFAAKIKAEDNPLELEIEPDEWDVAWVGSGSPGVGGSAVEARIDDGPYLDILPSSVEMEGPGGVVFPVSTELDDGRFEARFTRADAISLVASAAVGDLVVITVRGTLTDGITPWELTDTIEVVDEDDDNDNTIDAAVAAQAIADINAVIAFINGLVPDDLAANDANPLITKLQAAIASLERLNGNSATGQLGAFLNQLDAFAKTGKISEANAEILAEMVGDVLDLLNGSD